MRTLHDQSRLSLPFALPIGLPVGLLLSVIGAMPNCRAQAESWHLEATEQRDALGYAVCWLPDLDGDGRRDFAASSLQGAIGGSGRVRFFSAATGTLLRELTSAQPFDRFGSELALVADVDGDGLDDVAVSGGSGSAGSGPQLVDLFSSATGALLRTHASVPGLDAYGFHVIRLADLDGDGSDDYACANGGSPGTVAIHSGATGALIRSHLGSNWWDSLGYAIAALGDVDGDATGDYALGNPFDGFPAGPLGVAWIHSGRTGAVIHRLANLSGAGVTGFAIASAGDIDGDGRDDLLLGDPSYNLVEGRFAAISGASGATLWTVAAPPGSADSIGAFLAAAGDLDGDGDPDLVTSATGLAALAAHDGASGAPIGSFALPAPFGVTLDASVDASGDGVRDLLLGLPTADDTAQRREAGRAVVIDGGGAGVLAEARGRSFEPQLGSAMVLLEDRDGDGWREVAVGVPGGDGDTYGEVRVISGQSGGELARFVASQPGESFGAALASLADQDGDGLDELLVGAPTAVGGGRVDLLSSGTGAVLASFAPPSGAARFGHSVGAAQDSAGAWRIAIGDPQHDAGGGPIGRVELRALASGALIAGRNGWFAQAQHGHALDAVDDVNGDGAPDWIVAANGGTATQQGGLEMVDGANGQLLWRVTGARFGARVGDSVARIGDLDGDGIGDVVGGRVDGAAGNANGLIAARSGASGKELFRLFGAPSAAGTPAEFGTTVRGLGDLNGDGVDDFAVGAPGYAEDALLRGAVELVSGATASLLRRVDGPAELLARFGTSLAHPGWRADGRLDPDASPDLVAAGRDAISANLRRSRAQAHRLARLFLEIDPPVATDGTFVTLATRGGPASAAAGLWLVDFAGTPIDRFAAFGTLDAFGTFAVVDQVPPGLAGLDATFRSYAVGFSGRLVRSQDERIEFE